uniref:Uncharacterized protein n=1 Tax=Anguilla anguilla TaxID=7936 RepID=A0A0E9XC06_ANGAN
MISFVFFFFLQNIKNKKQKGSSISVNSAVWNDQVVLFYRIVLFCFCSSYDFTSTVQVANGFFSLKSNGSS